LTSDDKYADKWKESYQKYKILLKDNIEKYDLSNDYIQRSSEDLFELVKEWRFMFLRLMNILPPMPQPPPQIKIPSRVENELKEMVSKAISKELEGEDE